MGGHIAPPEVRAMRQPRLMSQMRVPANSLACQKHPPYKCPVIWFCQYCRRMAIHVHNAGLRMWMSSRWAPEGISSSSPLKGIMVWINSSVWSHLGTGGTGKDCWSFQCLVPHSIVANTSAAYFKAFSPNAIKHLTASWLGVRVQAMCLA